MPVVVVRRLFVPVWDIYVLATTVVVVSLVDTGPPMTSPVGSESEWPGECHGSRSVLSECRWSTRMGVRGHGFHGVGKVRYLCRVCVFNLSIAASSVNGHKFVLGHTVRSTLT